MGASGVELKGSAHLAARQRWGAVRDKGYSGL